MQTDENTTQPRLNWLLRHSGFVFKYVAAFVVGLSGIVGGIYAWKAYEDNKGPKNVIATFTKFNKYDGSMVIGRIDNKDDIHADKFKLVCKYNGKMKYIIDDPKVIKKFDDGVINIDIERLVAGQSCKIDLVGEKDFEIKDKIKLSWGSGRIKSVSVEPPPPDVDDMMQSVDKAGMPTNKSIEAYQKNNQLTVTR